MNVRDATDRDAADLLYRHGVGGLLVSVLASSALAIIAINETGTTLAYGWWFAIAIVLSLRAIDVVHFRRMGDGSDRLGRQDIRRFGMGLIATAILWAAFPLAELRVLDPMGRASTAVILAAMVGGSVTVLSPSLVLSTIYCASLLLPASTLFLLLPGFENTFLGILGWVFFIVMLMSSRVAHRATMSAVELSRTNEALLADLRSEMEDRKRIQADLEKAGAELEWRVNERTEQLQQANQKLRESEDRLHAILDNTPTAVYMKDLSGRYVFANRHFRELFAQGADVAGKTDEDFLPAGLVELVKRNDLKASTTGAPVEAEEMAPHSSGPRTYMSVKFPLRTAGSEPYAVCGISMDITDRKREESSRLRLTEELEAERARLQTILENIPIGVLVAEASSGEIVLANPQLMRLLNRRPHPGEKLADLCRSTLCHADGSPIGEQHPFMRVLKNGEVINGEEYLHESSNGKASWVRISGAPVANTAGGISAAVVTIDDVDAEKRAEDGLRRSNDELRQFAYAAAHDLQEPLRNVAIYTEFLGVSYKDQLDERAQQFITFAVEGAHRMQGLIRDLLAYTQVVDDGTAPEETVTKADEILQQVLFDLQAAISESNAEVSSEELPALPVKPVHLRQLFQNLISNALKYRGEDPPRIVVSAQKGMGGWNFCVRDNGIGIAPRYHDQIFGVFKRLHGSRYAGTGIGLALCKRIVEHYGGRIWVTSEAGCGASFFFTLPRENGSARNTDQASGKSAHC